MKISVEASVEACVLLAAWNSIKLSATDGSGVRAKIFAERQVGSMPRACELRQLGSGI